MSDTAVKWDLEPEVATAIRQRWWVSLAIMVLVFSSGTVIGSGLTMIAVNDKYDAKLKNPPSSCDHVLPAMQRELELSDDQSARVKTILADHDKAMGKIWLDMRPKVREQLKHLEDQVNGVLSTDQQTKWHAWLDQRRRRAWPSPPHSGRHHGRPQKPSHNDGAPTVRSERPPHEAKLPAGEQESSATAGKETAPTADETSVQK